MKAILLAGGLGTRISEETADKPKPMVRIGDKPIIWHLMSIFAAQGVNEFLIATGYKGEVIHDWVKTLETDWKITPIDTGLETQTGGRIKKCMETIPGERVFATYGDGLGNVSLEKLQHFHEVNGLLATVTAVRPPARFGVLESSNGVVTVFGEKNQALSGWINGGFFVLEPEVVTLIHEDSEPFETGAIPRMVAAQQLAAYHHQGFWQPMDTLREKNDLSLLATSGKPPMASTNIIDGSNFAFIFDLDGTLVDSAEQISKAVNKTLSDQGYSLRDETEILKDIGLPASELFRHLDLTSQELTEVISSFRRELALEIQSGNPVFEGALNFVHALKSKHFFIGVATSKPTELAELVIFNSKYRNLISQVEGTGQNLPKPDPGMINRIISRNHFVGGIMFGDRPEDMQAASRAGIISVGIAQTVFTKHELVEAGANFVYNDFFELIEKIRESGEEIIEYFN